MYLPISHYTATTKTATIGSARVAAAGGASAAGVATAAESSTPDHGPATTTPSGCRQGWLVGQRDVRIGVENTISSQRISVHG